MLFQTQYTSHCVKRWITLHPIVTTKTSTAQMIHHYSDRNISVSIQQEYYLWQSWLSLSAWGIRFLYIISVCINYTELITINSNPIFLFAKHLQQSDTQGYIQWNDTPAESYHQAHHCHNHSTHSHGALPMTTNDHLQFKYPVSSMEVLKPNRRVLFANTGPDPAINQILILRVNEF